MSVTVDISQLDNYVSTLEDFDSDEETPTTSKNQISDEDIAESDESAGESEVKSDSEKSETHSEKDEKSTDESSAEETDQDFEFDSE